MSNVTDQQMKSNILGMSSCTNSNIKLESDNKISRRRKKCRSTKINFNFKNIDDTIRLFNRSDHYSIERWISDFEELATMFKWNEMQKLVFGHKSRKSICMQFECYTIQGKIQGRIRE